MALLTSIKCLCCLIKCSKCIYFIKKAICYATTVLAVIIGISLLNSSNFSFKKLKEMF